MAIGDSNSRKDIAWKYAYLANHNNKNDLTCNLCGKVAKGGAYRLKQHLVGGYRPFVGYQKCPEHVKEDVNQYTLRKKTEKSNGTSKKKPRHVGPMDAFVSPPKSAKMGKSGKGVQTTINDAYKKELREKACVDIAKGMYEAAIPFNAVNYDSFNAAIQSIGRYGVGMKPPSYHEVRVPLLKKEVVHTNDKMNSHKEEWARAGCSIMSDGWKDKSHRSLINFLVNCSKGSMFIESIDASSYMKTGERMFQTLDSMVEKIGEDKVVQTPCATHCLDLMLEDVAKLPTIMRTIKRAIKLTGYIYNQTGLINMMRQFTGQRNLLRPAKTQFAKSFLTLSSMHKQKENLRKMFTSEDWTCSKWAKELIGKRVAQTVLMPTFWNTVVYSLKVSGLIVRVLRLVDEEKRSTMGYIYEAMDQAKEAIEKYFNRREERYREIFEIIDRRWDCQLHRPLHVAGYFLNPKFFYDNRTEIELVPNINQQDKILEELTLYNREEGLFGLEMAKRQRKKKAPADWWSAYGASTPSLQQFAVKVLSLACSSSRCEWNWSMFENVHSKKRNRLAQSRVNDLVYIKYNRAMKRRYNLCDTIDPFSLKDVDDGNEWLIGRVEEDEVEEFAEDDLVFNDDILTWGSVARASGVEEERFNFRSRMGPLGQATGSNEDDEENDEGYKSCDENDDGPLLDEDDDDYVD
ncbi:hypothetical protein ACB092_03G182200 [Castanea dentata]